MLRDFTLLRVDKSESRPDAAGVHSFDFAVSASSFQEARAIVRQVDEARWALKVYRTSHPRDSSVDFARRLTRALDSQDD